MSFEIDPSFVTVACDEYCLKVADGTHDSPKQTSNGKLLVTSKNVKDGRLLLDSAYFISDEDYAEINRRSKVDQWDLLLTMIGTVGETCIVSQSDPIFAIKNVGLLKCGTELRAKWLYYLLRSPQGQQLIEQRKKGSTQQYISLTEIRNFPVSYPSNELEMQGAVSVLSLLDDRITLLRETNATLEAIAQALFKSWFVDFDPVRAKAEGRARQDGERSGQPRMPQASDLPRPGAEAGAEAQGQPEGAIQGCMSAAEGRMPKAAMDATTAALFPDSFEESELGLVPKGWAVRSLDSIADYLNGLALQKFPPSEDSWLPVIKIAQLRKGDTVGADRAGRNIKPEYVIQNGDVLFSWSGSLEVVIWCGGEGALNQHLFKVTSAEFPKWFYYLWTRHHLPDFQQTAASKATTMGHIQRKHLTEAKVVVPSAEVLQEAGAFIAPLLDRWLSNAEQAQTLTQLRDTLLPRLISGQLRLPEAEATVEEVL